MKLLLHTCCAPCAIYSIDEAKTDGFSVTGFFYNPNIHPYSEYIKRKKETEVYFGSEGLNLISPEYSATDYFKNIIGKETFPHRCAICWEMRLREAVSFAKNNAFDAFTTTLLGSPYQDHAIIKSTCESLSRRNNMNFYYKDFRIGFKDAHKHARKKGIYCQNYCGCVFSMVEREEAKRSKKYTKQI